MQFDYRFTHTDNVNTFRKVRKLALAGYLVGCDYCACHRDYLYVCRLRSYHYNLVGLGVSTGVGCCDFFVGDWEYSFT